MFYFWNVNQLVHDLRAGIVTEFDKMRYLVATALINLFGVSNFRFVPINNYEALLKILFFGVTIGIIIWGIQHCYLINKRNDNKNFIERFICLSFPIGIRVFIFSFVVIFLILILAAFGLALFGDTLSQQLGTISTTLKQAQLGQITVTSPVLRKGLLRLHVINFIFSTVVSIICFIVIGRKIDEVGKDEA